MHFSILYIIILCMQDTYSFIHIIMYVYHFSDDRCNFQNNILRRKRSQKFQFNVLKWLIVNCRILHQKGSLFFEVQDWCCCNWGLYQPSLLPSPSTPVKILTTVLDLVVLRKIILLTGIKSYLHNQIPQARIHLGWG